MKILLVIGPLLFALTFCGLQDKLKSISGGSNSGSNSNSTTSGPSTANSGPNAEKANPTSTQQSIIDSATETKWDDQSLSWRLPAGWAKSEVTKDQFIYRSKDNANLIVSISSLGDDFPIETSLKAYYDQAMQQVKNGKYDSARMVEIDGLKGVEFVEAPPSSKGDVRRHQWIAYRRYLGTVQQINVMTACDAGNFDKHPDDFGAIMYSMKAVK